ncbi:unknown [Bacteroides sp. CAG:633]|nr:unknown [Bacteroides sp. CAG:633]
MCGKAIFEGIVTGICMAHERHLHGSRATLVRLASDTCTAHEQHLHGSTGYFYVCKPLKFSIGKNSI